MNIHEYQAKQLLQKYGAKVSKGVVALSESEIDSCVASFSAFPIAVKAQIHAGGRGKAGGVKLARSSDEAKKIARDMFGMILKTKQTGPQGKEVRRVYFEAGAEIEKEYYLSLTIDRGKRGVSLIVSQEGGTEIEEVSKERPDSILNISINPLFGLMGFHAIRATSFLGMSKDESKQFYTLLSSLFEAFMKSDAEQLEINPLILTKSNELVVLDAKMSFDDNAMFRQQDIYAMRDLSEEEEVEIEAASEDLNYIKMDGSIGCMVNGAGLAMATMDIIKHYGESPANFLDVGGTADENRVRRAFEIISRDPGVKGILVNIFGGIVKCDVIAEGILSAVSKSNLNIPLVIRLSGTNASKGKSLIESSGLNAEYAENLEEAAQKIVQAVKRGN